MKNGNVIGVDIRVEYKCPNIDRIVIQRVEQKSICIDPINMDVYINLKCCCCGEEHQLYFDGSDKKDLVLNG